MSVSTSEIELQNEEVERIIQDDEANENYLIEVTGDNPIRVGHTKRYALDGTTLSAGQTHTIDNLRGQELYAAAHAGQTAIRVRLAAANVQSQPERDVRVIGDVTVAQQTNESDVSTFSIDTNADQSAPDNLPDQDVPDGFAVVLLADSSNDEDIYLDDFPLSPGASIALSVSNTSNIEVYTSGTTNQTLFGLTEAP